MNNVLEESILFNILNTTEEDRYKSFFSRDVWSAEEFGALVCGFDPTRLKEILNEKIFPKNLQEEKKANESLIIANQFLADLVGLCEENPLEVNSLEGGLYLSCWKYIRWLAKKNIKMKVRFLRALPLNLLELFEAFDPENETLRNANIYSSEYHQAKLKVNVEALLQRNHPKKMRHIEIYNDPSIQKVLHSFRSDKNKPRWYKKDHVIKHWIAKWNRDCPRGRSSKN